MRKLALVALCLLVGLLVGLTLRPDDGTQVSLSPPETGATVSGMNHGKPLPRVASADEMLHSLGVLAVAVAVLVLANVPGERTGRRLEPDVPAPGALLLAVRGLRAPPTRA
jgi:hypothetical protein